MTNQPDSSREQEIERIAAVLHEHRLIGRIAFCTCGKWDSQGSERFEAHAAVAFYDAGLRDRAALRERVADVRGSSAQPAYMLGAEDMRAAVLALLDTTDAG